LKDEDNWYGPKFMLEVNAVLPSIDKGPVAEYVSPIIKLTSGTLHVRSFVFAGAAIKPALAFVPLIEP